MKGNTQVFTTVAAAIGTIVLFAAAPGLTSSTIVERLADLEIHSTNPNTSLNVTASGPEFLGQLLSSVPAKKGVVPVNQTARNSSTRSRELVRAKRAMPDSNFGAYTTFTLT